MTWFANALVLIGLILAGNKNKLAFIFTIIGELIWCYHGYIMGMYDLAIICGVFALVASVNLYKWNKKIDKNLEGN